jgi:hypothetical protein
MAMRRDEKHSTAGSQRWNMNHLQPRIIGQVQTANVQLDWWLDSNPVNSQKEERCWRKLQSENRSGRTTESQEADEISLSPNNHPHFKEEDIGRSRHSTVQRQQRSQNLMSDSLDDLSKSQGKRRSLINQTKKEGESETLRKKIRRTESERISSEKSTTRGGGFRVEGQIHTIGRNQVFFKSADASRVSFSTSCEQMLGLSSSRLLWLESLLSRYYFLFHSKCSLDRKVVVLVSFVKRLF